MIPDYFEAITAYRVWSVYPNGLMVGQTCQEPWPMFMPFVGRCAQVVGGGHVVGGRFVGAPVFDCDCGVHALKTLQDARARAIQSGGILGRLFTRGSIGCSSGRVWGSVKLWGRIVEHASGYRAEFAYPSELYCDDEPLAAIVAELYGVPCTLAELPQDAGDQWYLASRMNAVFIGSSGTSIYTTTSSVADSPRVPSTPTAEGLTGGSRWQKRQARSASARVVRNGFRA